SHQFHTLSLRDALPICPACQARMVQEGLQNEDELQSYFIKRMESYLNSHGRQIIGWDEIIEGGLAPNATVMSWRGTAGAITAARSEEHTSELQSRENLV